MLTEKELLPYDARSLRERGREQYDLLAAELRRLAREISDTDDWVGLLDKLNKVHAPTPAAMRAEYEEWTKRAPSFLPDTGLVTPTPGGSCARRASSPIRGTSSTSTRRRSSARRGSSST